MIERADNRSEEANYEIPASPVTLAISTRQPWAWAIIHAGKDIENRPFIQRFQSIVGHRVLLHASSIARQGEFAEAKQRLAELGVQCPPLEELERGGVVGSVLVTRIVRASQSRWWIGPGGLELAEPEPLPFRPCRGNTGLFRVPTP